MHNPWNYCQASLLCEHPQSSYVLSLKQTSKMRCFWSSKESCCCPQRGSIPWLPSSLAFSFLCRTARFSLLPSAAALSASQPLTSPHQREIETNVFLLPQSFSPRQGALAERQGALARFPCPEALQKDTPPLLLASALLLHWGMEDVAFGEARLAAVFAIQNKHLS